MWKFRLRYNAQVRVLRHEHGSMQKNQAYFVLVPPPASPPRPRPCPSCPPNTITIILESNTWKIRRRKLFLTFPRLSEQNVVGVGWGGKIESRSRVSKAEGSSETTKALFSSWRVKTEKNSAQIFSPSGLQRRNFIWKLILKEHYWDIST